MAKGFDQFRRNLEIKLHGLTNQVGREIRDKINRGEPALNVKLEQGTSTNTTVSVLLKGGAELPADKKTRVKEIIQFAIDDTMDQLP